VELSGRPEAADVITISLFASGTAPDGTPVHAARILVLHGAELINLPHPPNPAPPPPGFAFRVARTGSGRGTVTSAPPGIDCGETCAATYPSGTLVALTTAPAAVSVFGGFGGVEDCADGIVVMTAEITCTARFSPLPVIIAPPDGAHFPLDVSTPITVAWLGVPGAAGYFFEFTGPNQAFLTQNGTAPDPHGAGGSGGGFVVAETSVAAVLDPSFPHGSYQVCVIGLSSSGQPIEGFGDPITLVLGILPTVRPAITVPAEGSRLARGASVVFVWTPVAGAARYLFEFTRPNGQFTNPNGAAPDPDALGRVLVPGTGFSAAVPPDTPPG
jgi:hypothetical protein